VQWQSQRLIVHPHAALVGAHFVRTRCVVIATKTHRPHHGSAERHFVCVSVVVVVVGPGVVVCCVVVVLLWLESEAQPEINALATTIRQETIIFFIYTV
jgi:hypothetical protein